MDEDLAALVKDDTREKMGKAIDHVRHEMGNVRTGRASSALLEPLLVDYYGTPTPLRQLAGFSVPDAMLLVISPYDKGSLSAHREGDPVLGPGHQPHERRHRDPPGLSAVNRRAPQGDG